MNIKTILKKYDLSKLTVTTLGSHSALDICQGAKDEGIKTLVICQKGREKTYQHYYKTRGRLGCIDECLLLDRYDEILQSKVQKKLLSKNCVFVPHRSFEVYLHSDYKAIENSFNVPMFGNRYLLKIEERGKEFNQYDLLKQADIRFPLQFTDPKKIDRLVLVKVLEKERGFERAFFLAESYRDYQTQISKKLKQGVFTKKQLADSVIEEFILGVQVNFNFFYSSIDKRLELLGTDTRRQTNIEGILKIPASYQEEILKKVAVKYEEAGHIAVTVLESLLEKVFDLGERFVKTSQKLFPPGVIGPFALQSVITAGPPKKDIVVIDVSPRVPGSPGISATPYARYLYGKTITIGERIALEIKNAKELKSLSNILT